MGCLMNLYLHLKIRTRIALLCLCYSLCIVFAVIAGRSFSLTVSIFSTGLFVVLGAFFSGLLFWSVNDALKRISGYLTEMTGGNLLQQISAKRNNEISAIIRSIDCLQSTMRDIISKINQSAVQVSASARDVHSTSARIAVGTEEIAAQTNRVASASQSMDETSGTIAQNCLTVADMSNRASENARLGAEIVRQALGGMERIASRFDDAAKTVESLGTRSEQIGQIIGVIEDIADQTNLLALNAAIEAARAGEQGRGFAVVADEVRALAERTTRATREIGGMIKAIQSETQTAVTAMDESVAEVEQGTELSVKSGQALEQILSQANEVTMQVNQVATAAEEQTATTRDITTNIQAIMSVVDQTAHGTNEAASVSSKLSREAEELQKLVGQFKF